MYDYIPTFICTIIKIVQNHTHRYLVVVLILLPSSVLFVPVPAIRIYVGAYVWVQYGNGIGLTGRYLLSLEPK